MGQGHRKLNQTPHGIGLLSSALYPDLFCGFVGLKIEPAVESILGERRDRVHGPQDRRHEIDLKDLLELVATQLENFQTNEDVQGNQKMVETILEQLIEALVLEMQNRDGEGQGQSGDSQDNPLIQLVQELKMLKLLQLSVNAKTKSIDKLPEGTQKRSRMAKDTAGKQSRVEELTRKLARKLEKMDSQDAGDGR